MELSKNGKIVMDNFKEITKIPRCSGDEGAISQYLLDFAKKNNLEAFVEDNTGNIIIKKPATSCYEDSPTVILQGHLDMVCEKNQGIVHDFSRDALKLIEKDGFLSAQGTTLGADNGIAIAYAITILSSTEFEHPALEVILTTEEETSMKGAEFFNPKSLSGSRLLNLDAEEEGVFYISSAGGIDHHMYLDFSSTSPTLDSKCKIIISGLKGGHSGSDIHKERGNSIKLMARTLQLLNQKYKFEIADFSGGSKINAIPREATSSLYINKNEYSEIEKSILELQNLYNNEMGSADSVSIAIENNHDINIVMDSKAKSQLIDILLLIPSGIDHSSIEIEDFVISSQNLGVVKTDNNKVTISSSIRSSIKSLKEAMVINLNIIAKAFSLDFESEADYPEWQYKPQSELRDIAFALYEKMNGKKPVIKAIHAGLECGFFADGLKSQNIDILSFGPNMDGVHSPDEYLDIHSADRVFGFLVEFLKTLK